MAGRGSFVNRLIRVAGWFLIGAILLGLGAAIAWRVAVEMHRPAGVAAPGSETIDGAR